VRYLVRARVKPRREAALLDAIERGTLGRGSVAAGEYLRNMAAARVGADGVVKWVEVCYCATPLAEERPYWERYFDLVRVQDAHHRSRCRDLDGTEPWSCDTCDCSAALQRKLTARGERFLASLRRGSGAPTKRRAR
jgi:hypothetical protein